MSIPTAEDVIHHLEAVLNSDAVDAGLTNLLATEIIYNGQHLSAEEVIDVAGPLRAAIPDLRWRLTRVITDGDRAAALWTLTGTHQSDFTHPVLGQFSATGEKIQMVYSLFCRIEDGRIAEVEDVSDRLSLFQQLRVLPVLGLGDGPHTVPSRVRLEFLAAPRERQEQRRDE